MNYTESEFDFDITRMRLMCEAAEETLNDSEAKPEEKKKSRRLVSATVEGSYLLIQKYFNDAKNKESIDVVVSFSPSKSVESMEISYLKHSVFHKMLDNYLTAVLKAKDKKTLQELLVRLKEDAKHFIDKKHNQVNMIDGTVRSAMKEWKDNLTTSITNADIDKVFKKATPESENFKLTLMTCIVEYYKMLIKQNKLIASEVKSVGNQENETMDDEIDSIKVNMNMIEVRRILGKPKEVRKVERKSFKMTTESYTGLKITYNSSNKVVCIEHTNLSKSIDVGGKTIDKSSKISDLKSSFSDLTEESPSLFVSRRSNVAFKCNSEGKISSVKIGNSNYF